MKKFLHALAVFAALLLAGRADAAAPLVDAAWVKAHIDKPGIVFLDARSVRSAYNAGHIPGAVFTDYGRDGWRMNKDGVPGLLPPIPDLEKLIGGLGIGNRSHVVVVANGTSASEMGIATRIYWTFKVLGHDDVSVLDGGMRAYVADRSNPIQFGAVTPAPKIFRAHYRPELRATAADVREALADGHTGLVDHRPVEQFTGQSKSGIVARAGTIPGAANAPATAMTKPGTGVFKSAQALKAMFDKAGAKTDGASIDFCNAGHWASVGWFVQHELLGNKKARMYDGSMSDWAKNPNDPVEPGVPPK